VNKHLAERADGVSAPGCGDCGRPQLLASSRRPYAAQQKGLAVVLRLTDVRARKTGRPPSASPGEYRVIWKPSPLGWRQNGRCWAWRCCCQTGRFDCGSSGTGAKSKRWLYPVHHAGNCQSRRSWNSMAYAWNIENRLALVKSEQCGCITSPPRARNMMEKGNPDGYLGL